MLKFDFFISLQCLKNLKMFLKATCFKNGLRYELHVKPFKKGNTYILEY